MLVSFCVFILFAALLSIACSSTETATSDYDWYKLTTKIQNYQRDYVRAQLEGNIGAQERNAGHLKAQCTYAKRITTKNPRFVLPSVCHAFTR